LASTVWLILSRFICRSHPKRREHDRRAADKQPLAGIAKV